MNRTSAMDAELTVGTRETDPRVYARALWRWKWPFLAVLVVIPLAVYFVVSREQRVYQSSALVNPQPVTDVADQLSGGSGSSTPDIASQVAALITTTSVANQAAKRLPRPHPRGASLLNGVSTTADATTGFVTITAKASSPKRAAAVANAFAAAIGITRTRQTVRNLDNAVAQLSAELYSLPAGAQASRKQITRQIQLDQALRVAQGSNTPVVQAATPSATPVSPRVRTAVLLGVVGGLLLGLLVVAVAELSDHRIRKVEDLEELTGTPPIGVIPTFSGKSTTPAVAEAFHMLRASLRYFSVDRPCRSIVVSSPAKGEGKTSVAIQLALACAEAGDNVILIDADLRHPQIAERLGLRASHGLGGVLIGAATLNEAIVPYPAAPATSGGSLGVLAATVPPPNPAQLLGSRQMQTLVEELERTVDVVIIDTSPALIVADAFPLFKAASGTLLIARVNRTTKSAIRHFSWTVDHAGGALLGIVANAAGGRTPYSRYPYGSRPAAADSVISGNGNGAPMARGAAPNGRRDRAFETAPSATDPGATPPDPS